jgi:hypothetical protein
VTCVETTDTCFVCSSCNLTRDVASSPAIENPEDVKQQATAVLQAAKAGVKSTPRVFFFFPSARQARQHEQTEEEDDGLI